MSALESVTSRRALLGVSPSAIAATTGFAVLTLVALAQLDGVLKLLRWHANDWFVYGPLAAAIAGAAVFTGARYSDFTALLRASIRASATGLLIYLLVERPDFTPANALTAARAIEYVNVGYFLALACSVASLIRPAWVVPTAIYLISTRWLVEPISGFHMATLDIKYMVDMALYIVIFGLLVTKIGPRIHPWIGSPDRQNEIIGAAFGLHLANYFWSGIAKLVVGPTPWYWTLQNHTYNLLPYYVDAGFSPLGQWPWVAQLVHDGFKFAVVPMNAVIVVAQIFAIICIFRVSWLKIASILYDALHIGIYVFSGLFFWPWIWNNVTIWWAARSAKVIPFNTKVACVTAILLGAPLLNLNSAAWLAWFDVLDARETYFEAVTKDGRAIKAPNAFFLSHSYSMSHGYPARFALKGQYPFSIQNSVNDVKRNELSGKCAPATTFADKSPETPAETIERRHVLQRFLLAHHAKMLAREDAYGLGGYYLRVHHHASNPFLYEDFNRLSLHDVVGYRMVIESACFGLKQGHVTKRVLARNAEFYGVR